MAETSQAPTADTQLFRDVFNASPIGIAVENLEGKLLFVNSTLCSILGFSEEELRRKHRAEFSPPDDAASDETLSEKLRAGSIDRYQVEKRYVRRDGLRLWVRLSISLLNSGSSSLVLVMVEDITDKKSLELENKRAEESLRESEERLRLAAHAGRMFAYSWDAATDVIERSGEYAEILGVKKEEAAAGSAISVTVHPDDQQRLEAALARLTVENPTLRIAYRIIRPDGAITWLERTSRAYFDAQGELKRIVGMILDVTERKRAEEALEAMRRKLIEAQEQERARIARDLHDDVGQRLAMLAIGLEETQQNVPESASELRTLIDALKKHTAEISTDVQTISHELHSPSLEYLGIATAIRAFCKEFARQRKVETDFRSQDLTAPLSPEISLCLFRVLQEALHNAVKHSGVKHIEVRLTEYSGEVHLTVNDSGKGFDVEAAKQGRGLGLTSMRERVSLVNGTIAIESRPMGGTTIHVRVPLAKLQVTQIAV